MRRRSARHYLRSGRGQMTPDSLVQLSVAEAALGQNEEALRHARHAAEMLPPSVDAVGGPMCEMRLAQVLAMTGDRDGCFRQIRQTGEAAVWSYPWRFEIESDAGMTFGTIPASIVSWRSLLCLWRLMANIGSTHH